LKRIVDADRRPGQYVLTGSSDILTTAAAYDSLAGCVTTLASRPFPAAGIAGNGLCTLLDVMSDHAADCLDRLPRPGSLTRSQAIDLIVLGRFPGIRCPGDPDRLDPYRSYLTASWNGMWRWLPGYANRTCCGV